ncbi:efflux RND transporter periplasmic adaptor subunit [Humitalea sp. 24SJ18S-53]|uniref:efflux RND transporter periplasmic adaptor subunit n=1 Tax=Humitalea sp. 24SJ18S-53 TaxID=3422307 RepID=UPI003D664482
MRHRLALPRGPVRSALAVTLVASLSLTACDGGTPAAAPEIRPVRVMTVETRSGGDVVSLTGTVQAETEVNLAFRIEGRMIERAVNVGDSIVADQVVARLDRQNEENNVRAARAAVAAARGQLVEARNNYTRQRELLVSGFTTRVRYDEAVRTLQNAQSQADANEAQLNIAENRLGYTELRADAPGTVTARGAEPGEVVQAGRMIVQIARQEGRDAVFDVPPAVKDMADADPRIEVSLTMDPRVVAVGRVREVAPRADAATGTFQVRVGLTDPPAVMRLGSTVTGRMLVNSGPSIEIPATALTRADREPAVWVVDAATETVSLRRIEVVRFDPARVLVGQGLVPGDVIVTAGVQALRPGQKIRLLGAAAR